MATLPNFFVLTLAHFIARGFLFDDADEFLKNISDLTLISLSSQGA